jgi:CubicO group peptidase (beta-lactamase class C family)
MRTIPRGAPQLSSGPSTSSTPVPRLPLPTVAPLRRRKPALRPDRLTIAAGASRRRTLAAAVACGAFAAAAMLGTSGAAGAAGKAPRAGRGGAERRGRAPVPATVDRIVGAAMSKHDTPGMVVGVVNQGRLVVEHGYGVKKLGSPEQPDADTVFYIGSVSKAVTAVGAMLLVEQGKLDLDQPIATYLKGLPRTWNRIKVRQFMTHTSGIPQVPKSKTFADALARVAATPLAFRPGSNQEYNNFNFAVTGQVIEALSGLSYLDFMRQKVFAPLHMDHTGVHVQSPDLAIGYHDTPQGRRPEEPDVVSYGVPSGGLQSSLADLLKLDAALREGRILRPATVKAMFEPTIPPGSHHPWSFTPGWQSRFAGATQVIAKNGGVAGFHSMWQIVPSRGISVILLWNLADKGNDLWAETAQILKDAFGIPNQSGSAPETE